jgi:hypothetical protein
MQEQILVLWAPPQNVDKYNEADDYRMRSAALPSSGEGRFFLHLGQYSKSKHDVERECTNWADSQYVHPLLLFKINPLCMS